LEGSLKGWKSLRRPGRGKRFNLPKREEKRVMLKKEGKEENVPKIKEKGRQGALSFEEEKKNCFTAREKAARRP